MTKTNRIELTDQEQEQIAEAMPDMLEGIKSENPGLPIIGRGKSRKKILKLKQMR